MSSSLSESLFHAIKVGRVDRVRELLNEGADPNTDRADVLPLLFATRERQVACVEALLDGGADPSRPNDFGWTPLLEAVRSGRRDLVDPLVQAGANLLTTASTGDTLMHAAARAIDADRPAAAALVPHLVGLGVPVDTVNRKGLTAAMVATDIQNEVVFKALVAHGASLEKADPANLTLRERAAHWQVEAPTPSAPVVAPPRPVSASPLSSIAKRAPR
jgi:ankyrin repeat protein